MRLTACEPRGTDSNGAILVAGAIGVLTTGVGALTCGRWCGRRESVVRRERAAPGACGTRAGQLVAAPAAGEPVARWRSKGGSDALVTRSVAAARARQRGRPRDGESQSEARGSRLAAGSEHTTRMGSPGRPTREVVAGRPSYPAVAEVSIPRGSGRHEARRSRAAQSNSESTAATSPDPGRQSGSREDSESESSQNRLGLDLLEHLPELGKGASILGTISYGP